MAMAKITTPIFRVSFPNIFEPKAFGEGEAKYGVTMLFPKGTDISVMQKALMEAAKGKWGEDRRKWPGLLRSLDPRTYLSPTGKDGWPIRDGDTALYDGYEGMVYVAAKSKQRPGLVDRNLDPIIEKDDFYPGCWARATLVAFAYDSSGGKGVSFALMNLQKVRDDESFSSRIAAEKDFESFDDGSENPANYGQTGTDNW